ncbi:MAG: phosphatase PAP2 family protein [Candidatus Nanopelagicales bacterium]|nr:phosphatase PAP2 family protein [Candidatus Nanopelagicales bacterium]
MSSSDQAVPVKSKLPKWRITGRQWIWVVVVFIGIALVMWTYEKFNAGPDSSHWPTFWPFDAEAGRVLNQPYDPAFDSAPASDVGGHAETHTFVLRSWLDERLPFVPILAIPYLSFLALAPVIVPFINLGVSSFKRFLTEGLALIVSQLVLNVAYYFFQTEVLRDNAAQGVVAEGGAGGWLVGLVWGKDAPFNGYPSGHVTWTTITIIALWRLRHVIPKTAWILMGWMLLIYPATVLLRQHYLMDVYAGIFVGFACYWACMFLVEKPKLVPRGVPPLGEDPLAT